MEKMKKTKRVFKQVVSLALCLVIVFAITSCGKQSASTEKDGVVTLKWIFPGDRQADQDEVWAEFNKQLEKKANLNVEIEMVEASYDEKAKMMLATGEDYDICFTSSWSNNYLNAVNKGAYLPLDEYIDKKSDFYTYMPEYVWDSVKVDGKIYGIPSYQLMTFQNSVTMAQAVNEQCGFNLEDNGEVVPFDKVAEMVKTAYEKKPSLYEGKTLYATGAFNKLLNYESFSGIPNIVISKTSKDYKIELDVETDEYKNMLARNRNWYNKGYIRKDILSAKGTPGKFDIAVAFSTYKPGYQREIYATYNMPVLIRPLTEPYVEMGCGQKSAMAVLRTSKHAKEAVKFLSLMHTDKDLYNLFIYGIEGKHYDKDENGVVKVKDNTGYNMKTQWMFGNQFNAYYTEGQDTTAWEKTDENNRSALQSPLMGFSPDVSSLQTEIAQCSSINTEYQYVTQGAVEYEKLYKEYINKLKAAGVDNIKKEIQKQVDEWVKENKKK